MEYTINATQNMGDFNHHWNTCIGAGRACEGLRANWQRQLKMAVSECGFRYIRFHGLLSDDMGICMVEDGEIFFNYSYVDMLFDELLKMEIHPFVEFGFMPELLASGKDTQFWWKGNITPPKSYSLWTDLLTGLISHWIERYGKTEVLKWYFEIWNEPNLRAFWTGTKSEYFKLYEVSAKTIKSISPDLRVGGPATSNFVPDDRFAAETEDFSKHKTHLVEDLQSLDWKGVWLEDFLKFCSDKKLPLDFLSTHPYPTDFAIDGQETSNNTNIMKGRSRQFNSTQKDLQWIQNLLSQSAYPKAEIHLTEWSSSPSSRDYSHDYLPAATYVIKSNIDCIGLADSLSYWVFTDIFEEIGPAPEAFHGGFGLITMQDIKKPTYHAYRFLNQLGNELIEKSKNFILTKNEYGKLKGIVYHYPDEMQTAIPIAEYPHHETAEKYQKMGSSLELGIMISGLTANSNFTLEMLDNKHGNATSLWKTMGYPKNLLPEQQKALSNYSDSLNIKSETSNKTGILKLHLVLEPWSIIFISEN